MIKEEKITQQILSDLLSGVYCVDQYLEPERILAKKYNCSRPIIHRALIHIEMMGLIDIMPRKGVKVKDYKKHGKLKLFSYVVGLDKENIDDKLKLDLLDFISDIIKNIVSSLSKIKPHYLILEKPEHFFELFHYYSLLCDNQIYTYLLNEFKVGMINVFYYVIDELSFSKYITHLDECLVKGEQEQALTCIDDLMRIIKRKWLRGEDV